MMRTESPPLDVNAFEDLLPRIKQAVREDDRGALSDIHAETTDPKIRKVIRGADNLIIACRDKSNLTEKLALAMLQAALDEIEQEKKGRRA